MTLCGKKAVIVGMGQTALPATRLLIREGAEVFISEQDDTEKTRALAETLRALGATCELGGHSTAFFSNANLIVPSPGVSPKAPPILAAREANVLAHDVRILGEMELAFPYCRSRILAITGTNGKTTTTELLRALIAACGHSVVLAGNNAVPFSEAVLRDPAPAYIVLEVSSYQLETAQQFHPWAASVLNLTPDHLKRHGTMDEYTSVKERIFARQGNGDLAAINMDDSRVKKMMVGAGTCVVPFSVSQQLMDGFWVRERDICWGERVMAKVSDTPLRGRHNMENVLCALSLMGGGGFCWEKVLEGLRAFRGVEHRIEYVATIDGVVFFNDSKSTNVDSLKVALESFDAPVVLIAGGEGKGTDYRVLRELVGEKVNALVTLGEDAPQIEAAFSDLVPTQRAADMQDAVDRAGSIAAECAGSKTVLLSPACASFDMFENFEHRGRVFKDCVAHYLAARSKTQ